MSITSKTMVSDAALASKSMARLKIDRVFLTIGRNMLLDSFDFGERIAANHLNAAKIHLNKNQYPQALFQFEKALGFIDRGFMGRGPNAERPPTPKTMQLAIDLVNQIGAAPSDYSEIRDQMADALFSVPNPSMLTRSYSIYSQLGALKLERAASLPPAKFEDAMSFIESAQWFSDVSNADCDIARLAICEKILSNPWMDGLTSSIVLDAAQLANSIDPTNAPRRNLAVDFFMVNDSFV